MTLPRLNLQSTQQPLDQIVRGLDDPAVQDINPPYQRGHVWGVERQRALFRSLLMGLPTGAVVVNRRWDVEGDPFGVFTGDSAEVSVIDGKQRLTAMHSFLTGALTLPREWFETNNVGDTTADQEYITYDQLTPAGKRRVKNLNITVIETKVASVEAEAEVFDLVNFGGVVQGETDLAPEVEDTGDAELDAYRTGVVTSPEFREIQSTLRSAVGEESVSVDDAFASGAFGLARDLLGMGIDYFTPAESWALLWGDLTTPEDAAQT